MFWLVKGFLGLSGLRLGSGSWGGSVGWLVLFAGRFAVFWAKRRL